LKEGNNELNLFVLIEGANNTRTGKEKIL